jgi:dynein heavy chain, axonemal
MQYWSFPQSRPISPTDQHDIIDTVERTLSSFVKEPSEIDNERYIHYIENGTNESMIAPLSNEQLKKVMSLIPLKLTTSENKIIKLNIQELSEEIENDYAYAMRKSIVDYILINLDERERLRIEWIARPFNLKTIRAPVPWHGQCVESRDWIFKNLNTINKVNSTLQDIWFDEFVNTRFVSLKDLNESNLPAYPVDFEAFVKKKCLEERELLEKTWIPKCAKIILELKQYWKHLVPMNDEPASLELPMRFFGCIATEMSNQLRNLVVDSLAEFVDFIEQYKVFIHFILFHI